MCYDMEIELCKRDLFDMILNPDNKVLMIPFLKSKIQERYTKSQIQEALNHLNDGMGGELVN